MCFKAVYITSEMIQEILSKIGVTRKSLFYVGILKYFLNKDIFIPIRNETFDKNKNLVLFIKIENSFFFFSLSRYVNRFIKKLVINFEQNTQKYQKFMMDKKNCFK